MFWVCLLVSAKTMGSGKFGMTEWERSEVGMSDEW
jgi:hypothetical protein